MIWRLFSGKFVSIVLSFFILFPFTVHSHENEPQQTEITQWLILEPVGSHLPVYHDQKNIRGETYGIAHLLDDHHFGEPEWRPEAGKAISLNGQPVTWAETETGRITFSPPDADRPAFGWSAFYLESDRFTTGELKLSSHHPFRVYINGEKKGSKLTSESSGNEEEAGTHSESLRLTRGKHLVIVKSMYDRDNDAPWAVEASVSINGDAKVTTSLSPATTLDLETLSNQPSISNMAISPDGTLAALRLHQPAPPDGSGDSWIEIRNIRDGSVYRTYKGAMDFGQLQWAPAGRKFTYTEQEDGKTSIWMVDPETGEQVRLLKDTEDFSSYRWSPTGDFIVFGITEQPEEDRSGVSLLDDLQERRPWHFNRSFLSRLSVPEKTVQRLTAGELTTSMHDISKDGRYLLYSRSHIDYTQRPYSVSEYVIMDLETHDTDSLFTVPFGGSGSFSADGSTILFTGGPSMFGDKGINVPGDKVANDYDTQAYLYHRGRGEVTAITREFDPTVDQAVWGPRGDKIYMVTTDGAFRTLFEYDVSGDEFQIVDTEVEVIGQFDVAADSRRAVYSGTGISSPVRSYSLNLRNHRSARLHDPGTDHFANVSFGDSSVWTFASQDGVEIDGHVYYPPGFDERETYPVIVYYYGGTVPVTRAFGGRYPKELYASKGYLVYVLQPSGAIGYGQEFSALHVNDWGTIVADEIIDGVEQFLEAHPYADRERVGAIGASYGGFMTMLLMTRTDMFAAGVSHAGISNIASYWGEGFWGFQYSAIATAYSFPWNREDIYVGQSPLYSANKVQTPLLFLTGMSDTNVPPGESLQMYTALKLLERETAFVRVENQDHHIIDYQKYKLWKESILAWFDKYLKDQPQWWQEKYGE
jgi:dipeptidyl aminopeptidase/acylaminoacyl peptidase